MLKFTPGPAITAFALFISLNSTLPASAQVVGGVTGTVNGAASGAIGTVGGIAAGAGGIVGGAVGGAVSGTLGSSGLSGAGGAIASGRAVGKASAADILITGPRGSFSGFTTTNAAFVFGGPSGFGSSIVPSSVMEVRQRVAGKLVALSANSVEVRTADGATKTYQLAANMSNVLRPYLGQAISLRSADGVHITSIVGKTDVIRGLVTAVQGNVVTFVSPNGEVHTVQLSGNGTAGLRSGERILSVSNDFGKTAQVSIMKAGPRAGLSNIYLGRVSNVTADTATLGLGAMQQQFRIDGSLRPTLASLRGRTVAAVIPDGINIKSLMMSATLLNLAATLHSTAALPATGVKAVALVTGRERLSLQLPNGDVVSYLGNVNYLNLRARVPVTITPLDRYHVRIRAGSHVATFADANACVTVNANCRDSMSGHVVSVAPTAVSVRLGNGDTKTYLGNVLPLAANAGVPITITPLDAVHARVLAGAHATDLVDAQACVTINAGCDATPATVVAVGPSSISIRFPDGSIANLSGNPTPLGVSANVPVIVQPLDQAHAVVLANGQAEQLADAHLCVTLNADCSSATATNVTPANRGVLATANGAANAAKSAANAAACVAILNNGCTKGAAGGTSGGGTGSGGGGAPGSVANIVANGCVSINGSACVASVPNGGNGANGSNGGTNGGNGGNNGGAQNPGVINNPGAIGGPGGNNNAVNGGGPDTTLLSGPYVMASIPQMLAVLNNAAPCSGDGQLTVGVSDVNGSQPLSGAQVQVQGSTAPHWYTGADGTVHFMRLSTGTYHVVVAKPGYKTITSPDFKVDCTQASSLNFRLAQAGRRGVSAVQVARAPRITPAQIRLISAHSTTCVTHHYVRQTVSYVHRVRRVARTGHTRYLCH